MNYTLCKELKRAGFPQKGDGKSFVVLGMTRDGFPTGKHYIPTLSELISACGEVVLWKSPYGWHCAPANSNMLSTTYVDDTWYKDDIGNGSTPEIAVAQLWLALNKK
jgi:hypothetical protein